MKKQLLLIIFTVISIFSITAQTTIYAYRSFQESYSQSTQKGPIKYLTTNPSDVELIADQTRMGSIYSGEYYNYKWYAQVTQLGTQSTLEGLYTIDLNDGSRTLITKAGSHLVEMCYDYSTSTMYGIKSGAENLVKLNIETGETTSVGYFKNEQNSYIYILALAVDLDGQMYAVGMDDNFYRVDKTTAQCSLIGSTGVNAAFTQSMTFDHNNHILYWANNGDYTLYTINLTTGAASAIGKIGANGDDSTCAMIIPYINVAKGAPDRVTNRHIEAKGKDVKISWKNPSINAQGNTLTELTEIKIYRNDVLIKTISASSSDIGNDASYTDLSLADGLYAYNIVASNSNGDGGVDSESIDIYVGNNPPGVVNNFKVETGDNTAILSWEAPTTGMYGGDYDINSVTKYIITRTQGSSATEIEINDATTTTYTDSPGFGKYTYSIVAVNNMGKGTATTSGDIIVKPIDWILMKNGEAIIETDKEYKFYDVSGPNAYYPNSQNDTLIMRPSKANTSIVAKFTTFSFDTYADSLIVYNGAGTNKQLIGRYSATSVPSDLEELESTSSDGSLTFVFFSDIMSRDEGWEATISARERLNNDLSAVSLIGNLYPEVNVSSEYTIKIRNKGTTDVVGGDYKVKLLNTDKVVLAECSGVNVSASQEVELKLRFTPSTVGTINVYAEVEYSEDQDITNNKTKETTINVLSEGSKFIEIGNNLEELYIVPASFMSNESVSQTIYYAEEIGVKDMVLNVISYPFYSVTTNYATVPIKVWVGETDKKSIEDRNLYASEMTLVYEGNCPISTSDSEWSIPLTTPYEYSGKNLVIMVHKIAPGTESMGVTFKGTYGNYDDENKRTRNASVYFEGDVIDLENIIGYTAGTMVPDVKLLFSNSAGITEIMINKDFNVYPNPTTSMLFFNKDISEIKLISMSGQIVFSAENTSSINIESCPNGVYILQATSQDGTPIIKRIVKK